MLSRLASRDDGFTLIEVLVATLCSVVIIAALFAMINTTLHSATRTLTKSNATQRARYTLEKIMNELHSACLSFGATPIQSGSTGASLVFTGQYGTAASPTAVTHTIAYNGGSNALTDTSGGVTTNLLDNVSQSSGTPVFQYFAYEQPRNSLGALYTDAGGHPYMMLLDGTSFVPGTSALAANDPYPLTTPLSTTDAASAVEVKLTLVVGAHKTEGQVTSLSNVNDTVTDSAVMRLTPAANDDAPGTTFAPCK